MIKLINPIVLATNQGFVDAFWAEWSTGAYQTYPDCYEALEDFYISVFGERRYVNYDAFRMKRERMYKSKYGTDYNTSIQAPVETREEAKTKVTRKTKN